MKKSEIEARMLAARERWELDRKMCREMSELEERSRASRDRGQVIDLAAERLRRSKPSRGSA